ncbi:LOW QUALITY PROTEIN: discoidin, CUB and LCCL domain-containing protein 2 [Gadus chalcogrammus]|uniref:LOW QUALITY PROTEIN: discoidin, CUB and LCCL domain-containing protein 2 n=1 Tax=Gadus chalcogrammus TaxID=1042646 RepID=UPI0024C49280|nr:LOW QUALITY PROTEIN: discoidin, CUB and LCCL domain-containing protein 2 [Gadus chalcogrammus]
MPAQNHKKRVIRSLWIAFTFFGLNVHGLEADLKDGPVVSVTALPTPSSTVKPGHTVPVEHTSDGCGHTKLGPESGTLTSANYPKTYPQDGSCTWRLRVPQGRTLRLLLGDFDIEGSMDCTNGSLVITPSNGSPSIGPLCGRLTASEMKLSVSSNEASVIFRSGRHRAGWGFLLSYTTDQNPELISCKMTGTSLSSDQLSVYCPAGCKDVLGDVWGNSEQGYRDSSPICLSAVHGGVVSDSLGGRVNLTRGRGLRFYESTFANGVLSKTGSLSEHKLLFSKECNGHLNMSLVDSSSLWGRAGGQGKGLNPAGPLVTWTIEPDDQNPWVELDLGKKRKVTGIITTGSGRFYIESYSLLFRKDRKDWKPYKGALSKERKVRGELSAEWFQVFEAYSDGHPRVLNSLFPTVVARFVQLKPITWEKGASAEIQLLGCPIVKDTSKTFYNARPCWLSATFALTSSEGGALNIQRSADGKSNRKIPIGSSSNRKYSAGLSYFAELRLRDSGTPCFSVRTLDIMPVGTTNHQIAVKCVIRSLWLAFTFCGFSVHGLKGDGCGHTKLGPESGTLTSANYPGTYPQDVSCTWRLRVPQGRTLRLLLGDFDIERSMDCTNGSLVITPSNGSPSIGPLCGRLTALELKMSVSSNEASVIFRSGRHRSGRGFLLSYTTDQNPELISCKFTGTSLSSDQLSMYCPAGCKDVPVGNVTGNYDKGYSHRSLICLSAVHGGVVSDSQGGRVKLTRGRGLGSYEPTFANGVLSKRGSLSEHKLLFSKECNGHLNMSLVDSSSLWGRAGGQGKGLNPAGPLVTWTAEPDDQNPWVELDLGEKRKVTGIIITGSGKFYIESYTLLFRKDRKDWKPYKGALSKEEKVFEAYSDGHPRVLNSLFPPLVARFVQLKPITWEERASAGIQLLGCPVVKDTSKTVSSTAVNPTDAPVVSATALTTPPSTVTTGHAVTVEHTTSDQKVLVVVGVVLGLVLCASCLLAGFWLKRRKKNAQIKKYSTAKGPVDHQSLQRKSPGGESELISYPLENLQALNPAESRDQDTLPGPPPNDYAQPAAGGQTLSSTFRPGPNPGLTAAFSFSRNHGPATLPEYATPLPPEPEYATPFSEQLPEARDPARPKGAPGRDNRLRTTLPPPPPPPPTGGEASPDHTHYDCPSHRLLSNGYCTPSNQGAAPRPSSAVYSEPEQPYSLLQAQHTYEELL